MIPRYRAWYTPFKGKTIGQEMKYGQAGRLITHAEMSPDKYVLIQSTGLKDKNDVEIFEGDIALITHKSTNYADTYWHSYVEVFRAKNGAYRIRGKHIYETELYSNRKQLTVAGNIYNSPELLKRDRFMTTTKNPELLGGMNSDE